MSELDDLALLQAEIGDVSKAKGMGQIAKESGVAAKALQEPRQERQPELPNHYEGRARSRRQADNSTRTSLALRPSEHWKRANADHIVATYVERDVRGELGIHNIANFVVWFVLRLISVGKCLIMPPISLTYGRF